MINNYMKKIISELSNKEPIQKITPDSQALLINPPINSKKPIMQAINSEEMNTHQM